MVDQSSTNSYAMDFLVGPVVRSETGGRTETTGGALLVPYMV